MAVIMEVKHKIVSILKCGMDDRLFWVKLAYPWSPQQKAYGIFPLDFGLLQKTQVYDITGLCSKIICQKWTPLLRFLKHKCMQ